MTPVSHGVYAEPPTGIASHSKSHSTLSLAKIVELRRRSRIDRARQLASNIETQAQILRATQIYNQEAARLRLDKQLGSIGDNIPSVARVFHETRLAALTEEVTDLRRQQSESTHLVERRPRHSAGALRGAQVPVRSGPLDAYARIS